jgi:hypothetical protein|tara:strand:+ start:301 stop:756 length:456 start_codon:yes stop_codon:yes gene_type:complete
MVKYDTRTIKITYKGETRNIPKRYLPDSLSKADRQKQIKSIFEKKDRPKVKAKERRSSHTIKFNKLYGDKLDKMKGGRSKRNIAKITGIPFKALDEVYKKGEGAFYSSGSRPNQTADSWARGRMYAYITGGAKVRKADKDITEKYKVKFKH